MKATRLAVAALAVIAVFALSACGGAAEVPGGSGAVETGDSYNEASTKARAAVEKVAPDAVLVSAGNQGVATSATPEAWAFVYMSPKTKHAWNVVVAEGKVGAPQDVGQSGATIDLDTALTEDKVQVSAVEAIERARSRAKAAGEMPPNVMVGGTFASIQGSEAMGMTPGVWTVMLTNGSGTDGAKRYQVNMENGSVGEVK